MSFSQLTIREEQRADWFEPCMVVLVTLSTTVHDSTWKVDMKQMTV